MAKKSRRDKENVEKQAPVHVSHYTTRVVKEDRTVDAVLAVVFIALAVFFVYRGIRDWDLQIMFAIGELASGVVLAALGIFYYPRYVFEKIEVDGDHLTIHKLYFRKYELTFKDLTDVYADGKQKSKNALFKDSGSHAVILVFPKGKLRLPTDFCENWDFLKADLKMHGVAIRK